MTKLITSTADLQRTCDAFKKAEFITIDTEFLRDKTYYARLCLVQMATPDIDPVAIDPLAKGVDLSPLFDLLLDDSVLKVFHACRQDLEIFYDIMEALPVPIFDTQVAAMVCGYGDQTGYGALVQKICGETLDKGSQFTDWSRRPLSSKQLSYALADVTYLRDVYMHLQAELERRNRAHWAKEEMERLTDTETYHCNPQDAWKRLKLRSNKPEAYTILRRIAEWRETEARAKNVPRGRILKDDALTGIAINPPHGIEDFKKIRGIYPDFIRGKYAKPLLGIVKAARAEDNQRDNLPEKKFSVPRDAAPLLEMLKMLLRIVSSEHDVAAKLIATSGDLEMIAAGKTESSPVLKGWRYKVFGEEALSMIAGRVFLGIQDGKIVREQKPNANVNSNPKDLKP